MLHELFLNKDGNQNTNHYLRGDSDVLAFWPCIQGFVKASVPPGLSCFDCGNICLRTTIDFLQAKGHDIGRLLREEETDAALLFFGGLPSGNIPGYQGNSKAL